MTAVRTLTANPQTFAESYRKEGNFTPQLSRERQAGTQNRKFPKECNISPCTAAFLTRISLLCSARRRIEIDYLLLEYPIKFLSIPVSHGQYLQGLFKRAGCRQQNVVNKEHHC
jgi:hypothetical protein